MPFTKDKPTAGPGRPKGLQNKTNQDIKQLISKTVKWIANKERFEQIMADVAEKKPDVLINFLAKVAPKDLNIDIGEKKDNPILEGIISMRKNIAEQQKVIEVKEVKIEQK